MPDGFATVCSSVSLSRFIGTSIRCGQLPCLISTPIRLTQFAKRAGCAAKQPPDYLLSLLAGLPPINDPNVFVGHATADDAAVYRLSDDLALILTTDFFTPIVDRPYDFGAVAAANALSDVYAMAGTPLAALSLVGFPSGALAARGARRDPARGDRQGARGGHRDRRRAYDPDGGADLRPGRRRAGTSRAGHHQRGSPAGRLSGPDQAAGTGNHHDGRQAGRRSRRARSREAIAVMTTLNRDASGVFAQAGAHALTDVTGFGLLGHLRNLAAASGVSATVWNDLVPILPAARDYVRTGSRPAAPTPTGGSSPTGLTTIPISPNTSSSCSATPRPRAVCWPPCPATERKLKRLCGSFATWEPRPPPLIGSIEAGEPGRIHVHKMPSSGTTG